MAHSVAEQEAPQRDAKTGQFVKGYNGGPGRPAGSRNKLGEQFIADLYEHWKVNREEALDGCLKESPAAYCRVVASIVPKEMHLKANGFGDLTDSQIDGLIALARTALELHRGGEGVQDDAGGERQTLELQALPETE